MSSITTSGQIIKTWVEKGDNEKDIFSKFICYWVAFNCWLFTVTKIVHDRRALEGLYKKEGIKYKVGKAELKDTAMGGALQENGLAKVITDETGKKILGVHIIGPQASVLIHEAIVAMKANGTVDAITNSVYIHPALPEWLQRAFFAIE